MTTPSEKDDAIEELAEIIDLMIPLSTLGPLGAALEQIDDDLIAEVLKTLSKIRAHPDKRKQRKEARLARREARRQSKSAG